MLRKTIFSTFFFACLISAGLSGCNSNPTEDTGESTGTAGNGGSGNNQGSIAFHYTESAPVYFKKTPITTNTIVKTGSGTITSFSISGILPSGLAFSTTTGAISGTPTEGMYASTYTVTAKGAGGASATATVKITVHTNGTLLTSKSWKMTAATVSPGVKISGTTYTNIFSQLDKCAGDNSLAFNNSGSFTSKMGYIDCSTSSTYTATGSWSFQSSETRIKFTGGGETDYYDIVTLSETVLKLTTTEVDYGDGKSHTTTFTFGH